MASISKCQKCSKWHPNTTRAITLISIWIVLIGSNLIVFRLFDRLKFDQSHDIKLTI
jgi:hypothetical protein